MGEHDDDLDIPTPPAPPGDTDAIARALERIAVALERGFAELARGGAGRLAAPPRRKAPPA